MQLRSWRRQRCVRCLGEVELDDLLSRREKLNVKLQEILDQHTDAWGIKVGLVEVKQVDLPQEMQRAMAKQAEAEREKRAKIIHAEGEFQASAKLAEAAGVISKEPVALQLRYLQTSDRNRRGEEHDRGFPRADRYY